MKFKPGILVEDDLGSGCHTELEIPAHRSNSDERIEKRVRTHDIPTWSMFLNQHRLCETCVEMRLRALDFDAGCVLQNAAHAPMLFSANDSAVLRQTAFEIDGFADIDQLALTVVNQVDAWRPRK